MYVCMYVNVDVHVYTSMLAWALSLINTRMSMYMFTMVHTGTRCGA
jgi:hypothetical protein